MKIMPIIFIIALTVSCRHDMKSISPTAPDSSPGTTSYTFLALGDSYTKAESESFGQRYYLQLSDTLQEIGMQISQTKMIAETGWTTTDLLNAIDADGDTGHYDFVFLLIGVNNQYQGLSPEQYQTEFKTLLDKAIAFAKGKYDHVFVISIPDYAYTPYGQSHNPNFISSQIDVFNNINKQESKGVNYIYITDISRQGLTDASLVASDGLHPSGKMYKRWAEIILPQITAISKK